MTKLRSSVATCAVALAGLLGSACVDSLEPGAPESTPAAEEQLGTQEFFVLYDFEGGFDAATGEFTIERIEVPDNSPLDMGGLGIVENALWCGLRVVADGAAGTNPNDSIEIYTFPASIQFAAPPAAPPASCLAAGGNTGLYGILGVFCADVRVMNFFGTALTDVHVAIDFVGDDVNYGPYAGGLGTSVAPPSGMNASLIGIPALDAVWSYGNLDARGGAATASTETWTFRYAAAGGSFRFRGKVVSRISENCATTIDDDCDGVVNNGCGTFITGAPCVANNDCVSNYCNAGFCAGNPCADGVFNGTETDLDCGGAFCGATCLVGDDCDTAADCASGACRGTAGAETCRANRNPLVGEVAFTEFMALPSDNNAEWVEIQNTSLFTRDLEGCELVDRSSAGNEVVWPLGAIELSPGEVHVLVEPGAVGIVTTGLAASQWTQFTASTGFGLADTLDYLVLRCGGVEVDRVDWDSTVVDITETARSTQLDARQVSTVANDNDRQFCLAQATVARQYAVTATVPQYGTPGAANDNCADYAIEFCALQSPTARPEPGYSGSSVTYSARVRSPALTALTAAVDTSTRLVGQVATGTVGTDPGLDASWTGWTTIAANPTWTDASPTADVDEYRGALPVPATVGTTYDVAARFSGDGGLTWTYCDLDGNDLGAAGSNGYTPAQSGQILVQPPVAAPVAGDFVISEVLVNGRAIPSSTNEYEYVELYNRTAAPLDLSGCAIRETQSAVVTHPIVWSTSPVVAAGGYSVITTLASTPGFAYNGQVAGMAINNGGETITLVCGGVDIATVNFGTGDQDVEPYSLQLDPSRLSATSGNDATTTFQAKNYLAWYCNTPTVAGSNSFVTAGGTQYGTPGAANVSCVPVEACQLVAPLDLGEVATTSTHTVNATLTSGGLTGATTGVDAHHMLRIEAGLGPNGSTNPDSDAGWAWSTANPTAAWSNATADGYSATVVAPADPNESRDYAFRVSGRNGVAGSWTYCDGDGIGDGYEAAQAGALATPRFWTITSCQLATPAISGVRAADQVDVFGWVTAPGLTDLTFATDVSANLRMQFGYGADSSARGTWTWSNASANGFFFSMSGEDEYQYSLTVPSANGAPYDYGFRASGDGGLTWTDCTGTGDLPVSSYSVAWGDDASSGFTGIPGGRFTVNGQAWPNAGSPPGAPNADAWADYGIGPVGTTPLTDPDGWTWTRADYTGVTGNDWLFAKTMSLPAQGSYPAVLSGVWRFTGDGGATYFYADLDNTAGGSFNAMASYVVQAPAAGDLVITEIMANPTAIGDSTGEWFEVYNAKAYALNLNGLLTPVTTEGAGTASFTVSNDLVLAAGDYAVFAVSNLALDPSLDASPLPDGLFGAGFFLANSSDTLELTYGGVTVDTVSWNTSPFPSQSAGGFSIQLTNPTADNTTAANWCASTTRWDGATGDFGSPGSANAACAVPLLQPGDLVITEVFYAASGASFVNAEWIELYNTTGSTISFAATPIDFGDATIRGTVSTGSVAAGGRVVIANSEAVSAGVPGIDWGVANFLSSSGDTVTVSNAGAAVIDTIVYTAAWGVASNSGRTIQLDVDTTPTGAGNDAEADWCGGQTAIGATGWFGTPQAANSDCVETCTLGGSDLDFDGESGCNDAQCTGIPACTPPSAPDVIISEYIEGSSNSKGLEITVLSGSAVNLASCQLELYSNGSATVSATTALTTTSLNAGQSHTVCHASSAAGLLSFCVQTVTGGGAVNYNGDDAVVLRCSGTVVDSFGQVGFDPGTAWGNASPADSIYTADRTLRRVCGAAVDTVTNDVFAPHTSGQWVSAAQNTFTSFGMGNTNSRSCPATP